MWPKKNLIKEYFKYVCISLQICWNKAHITKIKANKQEKFLDFIFPSASHFFVPLYRDIFRSEAILMVFNSCPTILSETYSKMISASTIPELLKGYQWPSCGHIQWLPLSSHLTRPTGSIHGGPSLFLAKLSSLSLQDSALSKFSSYLSCCPFSVFFAYSSSDPQLLNFGCPGAQSSGCVSTPTPLLWWSQSISWL